MADDTPRKQDFTKSVLLDNDSKEGCGDHFLEGQNNENFIMIMKDNISFNSSVMGGHVKNKLSFGMDDITDPHRFKKEEEIGQDSRLDANHKSQTVDNFYKGDKTGVCHEKADCISARNNKYH